MLTKEQIKEIWNLKPNITLDNTGRGLFVIHQEIRNELCNMAMRLLNESDAAAEPRRSAETLVKDLKEIASDRAMPMFLAATIDQCIQEYEESDTLDWKLPAQPAAGDYSTGEPPMDGSVFLAITQRNVYVCKYHAGRFRVGAEWDELERQYIIAWASINPYKEART